jgi:4'-phosphopantetheinyl transferase
MTEEWRSWAEPAGLADGEVHVWRFRLDRSSEEHLASFAFALSDDERRRAERFRIGDLRRRFVVGRLTLKAVLGHYLGCLWDKVEFSYGTHGKPRLAEAFAAVGLEFNLAHSYELALVALTKRRAVGVDVEAIRPMRDAERIIQRFFSPREQAEFLALPETERLAAFFRGWTRKEAFLKATGTGLATELDAFDVTLGPDEPAALLRVGDDPSEAARWSLHDLDAGPGFAAALAVSGTIGRDAIRLVDLGPPASALTRSATPRSD